MSYTVESLDFDEYFGNHRIKNFVRGKMIRVSDYMHDLIDSFVARYFSEVSVKNAINEMKEKIDEYESDIADFDKIINDASKSDTEKEEILEKKGTVKRKLAKFKIKCGRQQRRKRNMGYDWNQYQDEGLESEKGANTVNDTEEFATIPGFNDENLKDFYDKATVDLTQEDSLEANEHADLSELPQENINELPVDTNEMEVSNSDENTLAIEPIKENDEKLTQNDGLEANEHADLFELPQENISELPVEADEMEVSNLDESTLENDEKLTQNNDLAVNENILPMVDMPDEINVNNDKNNNEEKKSLGELVYGDNYWEDYNNSSDKEKETLNTMITEDVYYRFAVINGISLEEAKQTLDGYKKGFSDALEQYRAVFEEGALGIYKKVIDNTNKKYEEYQANGQLDTMVEKFNKVNNVASYEEQIQTYQSKLNESEKENEAKDKEIEQLKAQITAMKSDFDNMRKTIEQIKIESSRIISDTNLESEAEINDSVKSI